MSRSHTTKAYDASAAAREHLRAVGPEMRAPPPVVSQAPKHRYSRASSITAASSSHASQRSESPPRTQRCQKWSSAPPPQPSSGGGARREPSSSQQKASSVKRSERFSRQPATGTHGAVGDGRRRSSTPAGSLRRPDATRAPLRLHRRPYLRPHAALQSVIMASRYHGRPETALARAASIGGGVAASAASSPCGRLNLYVCRQFEKLQPASRNASSTRAPRDESDDARPRPPRARRARRHRVVRPVN